jgi:2-polyprenyl-6-methoxyphenol hydroxylase-like FAD-dependent oxidoreductase
MKHEVEVVFDTRITSVDQSHPSITLENGSVVKGDLVVGADGA